MKTTAVSNNQFRQNNKQNKINNKQNVQFRGFTQGLIKTWEVIDKSRGLQFTVEDMLGTNLPRTYSGAMSGYEYTHKVNIPYLYQEGIREFLTGPTMTLMPIAILGVANRLTGKTANTHKNNIINLSHLAQQLPKENVDESTFKNNFFKATTQDMLMQTLGKDANLENIDEDIENLTTKISQYSDMATQAKSKADKKNAKQALGELEEKFEQIIKTRKNDFTNTDFSTATVSLSKEKTIKTKFKNYVNYATNYAHDYTKANKNENGIIDLATETIDKFKNNRVGKRMLTVGAMIFLTGYVMSFIPKIYTFFSGKINPAGTAIYAEAQKRGGNQ